MIRIYAPTPMLARLTQPVLASPCATGTCSEVVSLLACTTGGSSFRQIAAH